ncbi:hypothetical protein L218DRAFT_961753 [Marasmius fiardii PR-910]|nr:hypothetical protein L218DRAFT_961753 [Marasmius fiardii PR-910]
MAMAMFHQLQGLSPMTPVSLLLILNHGPPTSPFANPDTFVVGLKDQDTSLSEEGEIREVPTAEELV